MPQLLGGFGGFTELTQPVNIFHVMRGAEIWTLFIIIIINQIMPIKIWWLRQSKLPLDF